MEVPFSFIQLRIKSIVSRKLVDSETTDNIYNFLNQSLGNQDKKYIITNLKLKAAIGRLEVKQQFCTFRLKQIINREIRDHIKENNTYEKGIEIIHNNKQLFF